ncbi:uncharacterized protein [Palaemon carinicauda]|uniref:uncharacterized protein n=1 Tax=Palaemon carinicauda TaxID=392227 RepID=UPI0035B6A9C8
MGWRAFRKQNEIIKALTRIVDVHSYCEGLTPPTDNLVVSQTIIDNTAVALGCPGTDPFISTGYGRVFVAECKGENFSPGQQVNCSSTVVDTEFTLDPCTGTPTPLNNSDLMATKLTVNDANGSPEDIAYFMQCQAGLQWISGSSVQMSSCRSGVWTDVLDMCVPGCNPPRDCSELYDKGFYVDGLFNVVPSGEIHHDDVQTVTAEVGFVSSISGLNTLEKQWQDVNLGGVRRKVVQMLLLPEIRSGDWEECITILLSNIYAVITVEDGVGPLPIFHTYVCQNPTISNCYTPQPNSKKQLKS